MYVCFCVLIMVSVFAFASSATEVNRLNVIKLVEVHLRIQGKQATPKSDEGKREKRSVSTFDAAAITDTVNSLRSSVGASNMNYLTYSSSLAADAANWTSYCDFDADVYGNTTGYVITVINSNSIDHISTLKQIFNSSTYYYALRSVYLLSVGAGETFCSTARYNGTSYSNVNLAAYAFSSSSYFNETQQQYTLGEQCTTCLSGSYWCDEGLCKDDCSDSDSNCYCNSYCLNCAATDRTTCSCRCLEGWTGSRCETGNVLNATTPTCSTTPRISRTSTTTSTTTIAPSTTTSTTTIAPSTTTSTTRIAPSTTTSTTRIAPSTTSTTRIAPSTTSTTRIAPSTTTSTTRIAPSITKSINKPNDAVTTSGSLKNLLFQLAFYATVALFLRF